MKFKIVVPVYNSEKWIKKCLLSIYDQVYTNYDCVIINDASTDGTADVIESLNQIKNDSRFSVIHNSENVKSLKNIVDGFNVLNCKNEPESVLMAVDGDDFLFSEYSLQIVYQAYQQHNPLLTYGSWLGYPGGIDRCGSYPNDVIQSNSYRNATFRASHLRTFKSKLWNSIKDEDLRDVDGLFGEKGKYLEAAWDVALMLPMLEMAQERHVFIQNILYCYNQHNPLSEYKVNSRKQIDVENYVKRKQPYERF